MSVPLFKQHLVRDALAVNLFSVTNSFPLELIFLFYLQQCLYLCQLECGGRGGRRGLAATGEAADGPGVAAVEANNTGTTIVSANISSLVPETGLGVSTRSGGLGETMRAGELGNSMLSGLAHGNGIGDSLRSGLWSGSARGESILPALGRWAKNITTPTGHGDGGLTASFSERDGLKVTGLSDAMSTPRNLENVLQQKRHQVEVSGRTWGWNAWLQSWRSGMVGVWS
jgi:hypothetical protein